TARIPVLLDVAERAEPTTRCLVERRRNRAGALVGEAPEVDADRLAPARAETGRGAGEEGRLLPVVPEEQGGKAPVDEGRARRMARAVGQVDRRRGEIPSVHPHADLEGGQRAERAGGSAVEADADRV